MDEHYAVDVNLGALGEARRLYPQVRFSNASLTALPFPDDFFDDDDVHAVCVTEKIGYILQWRLSKIAFDFLKQSLLNLRMRAVRTRERNDLQRSLTRGDNLFGSRLPSCSSLRLRSAA